MFRRAKSPDRMTKKYPVCPMLTHMEDTESFDELANAFASRPLEEGFLAVTGTLARRRAELGTEAWREFARTSPALQPLKDLLRREPLAQRAMSAPRGSPWDAISTDLACGIIGLPDGTEAWAAECHALLRAGPLCQSIRRRRELAAEYLDGVCGDHHFPRVLALSCGHARELSMSRLYALGRVGDFCAVDSDVESLRLLERVHRERIRPIPADPVKFIASGAQQGLFHGIYSLTLAERLDDAALRECLPQLLRLLRPGCRLLLVTAPPTLPDLAYVEVALDWWPVCRTAKRLASLAREAAAGAGLRAEVEEWQEPELGRVTVRRMS
jgi:hypothetical protein